MIALTSSKLQVDHEWLSYSSCIWFTFSTFIGESVMRSANITNVSYNKMSAK